MKVSYDKWLNTCIVKYCIFASFYGIAIGCFSAKNFVEMNHSCHTCEKKN